MFNNALFSISKDFILQHVTQEDIFKRYLGLEPTVEGSFCNPLRNDKTPGCNFYVDDRGMWKFKDYAFRVNWDCFNVVEYVENCSFKEALIRVAIDFGLVEGEAAKTYLATIQRKPKEKLQIRIKRRAWTNEDLAIFARWHIRDEALHRFDVFPVSNVWFVKGGILVPAYYYTKGDPAFAYHWLGYDYKIYFPLRKKGSKFLQPTSDYLQGYKQLPPTGTNLLHTKSFKDVMFIDNFSSLFDLYSVAPLSEYIVIKPDLFTDLYNRFDNQATLFDFDRTGIALARKYEQQYKLPFFFFGKEYRGGIFKAPTGIKDISDYGEVNGLDKSKRLIETVLYGAPSKGGIIKPNDLF